ncbi:uncharacterized protein B0J16DRAFT_386769 [Fusarium flagelliforme]|uniref:uncharacterized protein n=1 Tax=Fusarium flagelliforme TaxID=2675880 RepID=UPI001E8EAFC7|nr:uncharacterized protein B0J16DRAFT_386769 [Fusarium flagelliforme]KAH7183695.1 hypothetical protein B0J16DRAFT_386769 [Fusarium flagelliforme]
MGFGQMTIALYLSALPGGMTFTIDEIKQDAPSGFWAHISYPNGITFPHTFTPSDITEDSGTLPLHRWMGDHAALPERNIKGSRSIGTSEWGIFSRPDQTNFIWQIEGQQRTFRAPIPTLSYLDDSRLAVAYAPDEQKYVFGVSNQQDLIVKLLQGGVGAILTGHKLLYSTAAGMVASIGGTAVVVVV